MSRDADPTDDNENGTTNADEEKQEYDEDDLDSSDEALMEMLGLTSLSHVGQEDDEEDYSKYPQHNASNLCSNKNKLPILEEETLVSEYSSQLKSLRDQYQKEAICIFPRQEFSIPAEHLRQLTEALVWGGHHVQADRTYENIQVLKRKSREKQDEEAVEIEHRRTLTRLEHFVDAHEGWSELCHGYLRKLLSATLGTEMVLYKEKLNLKPPGGSGFAPHLDAPSLRVALGSDGPQTFVTVMVAIDDMTAKNGCLRVAKGPWTETNACPVIQPESNGNPDAGGRAGAIPIPDAEKLNFEDIEIKGGMIAAFNGWAPHRSGANASPFPRRAVFLTYNRKSEGDFHKRYYERMEQLRNEWRVSVGLADRQQRMEDEKTELEALSTIPKI